MGMFRHHDSNMIQRAVMWLKTIIHEESHFKRKTQCVKSFTPNWKKLKMLNTTELVKNLPIILPYYFKNMPIFACQIVDCHLV